LITSTAARVAASSSAGALHVITESAPAGLSPVAAVTTTLPHGRPPTRTVTPARKSDPAIVIAKAPAHGPWSGETARMEGGGPCAKKVCDATRLWAWAVLDGIFFLLLKNLLYIVGCLAGLRMQPRASLVTNRVRHHKYTRHSRAVFTAPARHCPEEGPGEPHCCSGASSSTTESIHGGPGRSMHRPTCLSRHPNS